jgi:hypothetical protein
LFVTYSGAVERRWCLEISPVSEELVRPGGFENIPYFSLDCPRHTVTCRKGLKRFVKGNAYNSIGYFEEHTERNGSWAM